MTISDFPAIPFIHTNFKKRCYKISTYLLKTFTFHISHPPVQPKNTRTHEATVCVLWFGAARVEVINGRSEVIGSALDSSAVRRCLVSRQAESRPGAATHRSGRCISHSPARRSSPLLSLWASAYIAGTSLFILFDCIIDMDQIEAQ